MKKTFKMLFLFKTNDYICNVFFERKLRQNIIKKPQFYLSYLKGKRAYHKGKQSKPDAANRRFAFGAGSWLVLMISRSKGHKNLDIERGKNES
jgi:hypothetical protein